MRGLLSVFRTRARACSLARSLTRPPQCARAYVCHEHTHTHTHTHTHALYTYPHAHARTSLWAALNRNVPGILEACNMKLHGLNLGIPRPIYSNQPRCLWPHHKGAAWGATHPSRSRTRNLRILDPAYYPLRYSGGETGECVMGAVEGSVTVSVGQTHCWRTGGRPGRRPRDARRGGP